VLLISCVVNLAGITTSPVLQGSLQRPPKAEVKALYVDYLDLGSPLTEIDELPDCDLSDDDQHRIMIPDDESDPDLDFIVIDPDDFPISHMP